MNPNLSPAQEAVIERMWRGDSLHVDYRLKSSSAFFADEDEKNLIRSAMALFERDLIEWSLAAFGQTFAFLTEAGRSYAHTKYGEAEGGGGN